MSVRDYKKLLVFLFEKFNGNQNLMLKELLEKNLKASPKDVNDYLKENHININDYCCYIDEDYPDSLKGLDKTPVFVFKKDKVS